MSGEIHTRGQAPENRNQYRHRQDIHIVAQGHIVKAGFALVGTDGMQTFCTFKRESKHLYRVGDAWGIPKALIKDFEFFEIHEFDKKVVYRTTREIVLEHGIDMQRLNHEEQMMLARQHWITRSFDDYDENKWD